MFLFKFTIKTVALCYREEVHNQTITANDHQEADLFSHFYRRLKIRSRAAVTGDVMAADVSPPPADAALPVPVQVRPQDVDREDG